MKYYVAWYPTPADPKFWHWFQIDGILVSLSKIRGRDLKHAIAVGIHRYLDYDGSIFLDGGSFGFPHYQSPYTQFELLQMQQWLRPNLFSHLDHPYVGRYLIPEAQKWELLASTIENARVATEWQRKHGEQYAIVYTIQGWDLESVEYCARKLSKLERQYYALGSLIGVPANEIIRRVSLVRKIIGPRPRLHLFGISNIPALRIIAGKVDSFDSSTPTKAAAFKEIVTNNIERQHVDTSHLNRCQCPICKMNPSVLPVKEDAKGERKRFNTYRAIHNAYAITEFVRGIQRLSPTGLARISEKKV